MCYGLVEACGKCDLYTLYILWRPQTKFSFSGDSLLKISNSWTFLDFSFWASYFQEKEETLFCHALTHFFIKSCRWD